MLGSNDFNVIWVYGIEPDQVPLRLALAED